MRNSVEVLLFINLAIHKREKPCSSFINPTSLFISSNSLICRLLEAVAKRLIMSTNFNDRQKGSFRKRNPKIDEGWFISRVECWKVTYLICAIFLLVKWRKVVILSPGKVFRSKILESKSRGNLRSQFWSSHIFRQELLHDWHYMFLFSKWNLRLWKFMLISPVRNWNLLTRQRIGKRCDFSRCHASIHRRPIIYSVSLGLKMFGRITVRGFEERKSYINHAFVLNIIYYFSIPSSSIVSTPNPPDDKAVFSWIFKPISTLFHAHRWCKQRQLPKHSSKNSFSEINWDILVGMTVRKDETK